MAARKREPEIYVAKESFSCELGGDPVFVTKGERIRAGHPLLRAQAGYFEPADTNIHYDVEQATAAPGEKRS